MALLTDMFSSVSIRVLVCATLALAGSAASVTALGQAAAYPSKSIRLILPGAPGGGGDVLGRVLAKKLSENLGQPVIVDNRAGGGGLIATEQTARMPPDGYTLLLGYAGSLALAPSLYKSLAYDPVHDFSSITKGVVVTNVLVVHPSLPVKTAREFLALARAKPRALNYSTSGYGSAAHVASELFALKGSVEFVHVPYKGGGPAVADLVAGHVQFSFATAPSALSLIKAGKLRPLGVTTPTRFPTLPDVPTISEAVFPGFEASNWYCFVTPANTPKDIVAKLNYEFRRALTSPDVAQTLLAQGMEPTPSSPEELHEYIKSEILKWAEVVKARGIKAE